MRKLIFILLLLSNSINLFAQDSAWVTITPSRGYFTFKLPAQPASYDTVNMMFYTYSVDSEIVMQIYYYNADTTFGNNTSDSTDNPLLLFAGQLIYSTNGTLASIEDINFYEQPVRPILKGKEIGITYPISETNQEYVFTRVYHDGHSMLAFYISAPDTRINDLLLFKNVFFQNITILN